MAQSVDARFSTEKSNYLVGEPLFVILTVSNKTGETIWLDIQPPDLAAFRCDTFAIEVPGASPAEDQWGCGVAGSCLRGLREVLPHKNVILRQLVNQQFRLQAGAYSIRAQTTIVVHNQDLLDSSKVEQVNAFDTLQVRVQRGSQNELEAAFGPIVTQLNDSDLMQRASAAAAITELAQDRNRLEATSAAARNQAERFDVCDRAAGYHQLFARWREFKRPWAGLLRIKHGSRLDQPWLPNVFTRTVRALRTQSAL